MRRDKDREREKERENERERQRHREIPFFPTLENRYESYRYKLAVRSDVMVIYRTILREDSSSIGEYRYGIHTSILSFSLRHVSRPLPLPSPPPPVPLAPSQFAALPFTTSELAGCSRGREGGGGQRSRWGFSGICRLKPPTGLVTTQFQLLGRYKKSKKSKGEGGRGGGRETALRAGIRTCATHFRLAFWNIWIPKRIICTLEMQKRYGR